MDAIKNNLLIIFYILSILKTLLLRITIIISLFLLTSDVSTATGSYWIEVKANENGTQWLDKNSRKIISPQKISIISRFRPITKNPYNVNSDIIYVMEIDCLNDVYKDKYVNGKRQSSEKWLSPNGDILISETINSACVKKL